MVFKKKGKPAPERERFIYKVLINYYRIIVDFPSDFRRYITATNIIYLIIRYLVL